MQNPTLSRETLATRGILHRDAKSFESVGADPTTSNITPIQPIITDKNSEYRSSTLRMPNNISDVLNAPPGRVPKFDQVKSGGFNVPRPEEQSKFKKSPIKAIEASSSLSPQRRKAPIKVDKI